MVRVVFIVCALSLFASEAMQAGRNLKKVTKASVIIDDGLERVASQGGGHYVPGLDNPSTLTWYPVDSMANAFGPASNVTPLVYDPATNVVALIHRGASPYALGSGQLWYNISRNAGVTWRRVGELNGGAPIDCRYPSAAISNPANNNDTNQCLFVYVAPNLQNAGTWGYFTYGVDYPLGGGSGSGVADLTLLGSSGGTIFGAYNSSWINWIATQAGTGLLNHSHLWRTNDYVTVSGSFPSVWRDSTPVFINAIAPINSMGRPTGSYYAMQGFWEGDTTGYDYFPFNGGYSKSTNDGATWSAQWVRPQPDWLIATGLRRGWDLYDFAQPPGATVSWNSDFAVDANGRGHFFHVVVDSPWTEREPRGIIEIYETGTGWAYKWVAPELNTYTGLGYPGFTGSPPTPYLDQTHVAPKASVSPDGQVLTLVWLNAATMAPADSFPDIWFSYRKITDNAWSTPLNLTQTPGFPELLLHAAPLLKYNGGDSYTLFLGRSYQCNINTYPPDNGVKTTFFVSAYTFSTSSSISVALANGWNLISNPVTNPIPGDSVKQMYPTSLNPYAFEFSGGYVQKYRLANGKGYWEKFPGAVSQPITGTPRTLDSISVVAGWNIVGSISCTVDTSTIVSVPAGLRASSWFKYAAGYTPTTQIVAGAGYWVKANGVGKFVFVCPPLGAAKAQASGTGVVDVLNSVTITDSKGGSQTLYFGANETIPVSQYVMPPLPPVGAFDARFETSEGGSMVQAHGEGSGEFTVAIQSDAYPVTVTWIVKGGLYEVKAGGVTQEMRGEGTLKISNSDVNRLFLKLTGNGQMPKEYSLSQNYPNPFNPTTTIKYDLPKDSRVSLRLFNILGQEVATLVNEEQKAGYRSVEWNAANVASGIYLYILQAGDFVDVKKLVLVK